MSVHQIKYELLGEESSAKLLRHRHVYVQVCLLLVLCAISSAAVFITWTVIYRHHVNVPPTADAFPPLYSQRANLLAERLHSLHINSTAAHPALPISSPAANATLRLTIYDDDERVYPSRLGAFLPAAATDPPLRLVCYYVGSESGPQLLPPASIHPHLCTHLNIGMASVAADNAIQLSAQLVASLHQITALRLANPALRILLWVGGADSSAQFAAMVATHATRMQFVRSIRDTLAAFRLDGVDLDWEFPAANAQQRQRQHFMQLLHEVRREYQRQRRTYLLSVAVAAPETIANLAYDVPQIEQYVDYVNVMTYDYHAWSRWTPFTGLNAPLAARPEEVAAGGSYLGQLNINASVRWWLAAGLSRGKLVVGVPTYGHSFKLVNAFNADIMSPASGFGDLGDLGFVTYPDVCWFMRNNYFVRRRFDAAACSPYLSAGSEWLSYEDEQSADCKAAYVRRSGFGGLMVFSLNADDWRGEQCDLRSQGDKEEQSSGAEVGGSWSRNSTFPLIRRLHQTLFGQPVRDA